jgi:hypothetical protein
VQVLPPVILCSSHIGEERELIAGTSFLPASLRWAGEQVGYNKENTRNALFHVTREPRGLRLV